MKHKLDQHGIAHLALVLILVIVVVGVAGYISFSRINQNQPGESKVLDGGESEPEVVLQNLGLESLDNVLITNDAVREYESMGLKGFYPFGDKLEGKTDSRLNPNFEFSSLKPGTKVVSAIDGVVAFIKEQAETGDSEVFIQSKEGSIWTIGYDHISNLQVKKGDLVKAGDVIGDPTVQGNGALRFEIQVNRDEAGDTTHICPSNLLSGDVRDKLLEDLSVMQQQWNSTTGLSLYNLQDQNPVGCIKQTMTVAESEGR